MKAAFQIAGERMRAALEPQVRRWRARAPMEAGGASNEGRGISRMDMTWLTDRIALGGGIWSSANMAEVARMGITHVIDMQIEFDDTALAEPFGIEVLWNAIDDDFEPKPVEVLQRGVEFGLRALDEAHAKVYIHCAAGVHRAPMMALALLCATGWEV